MRHFTKFILVGALAVTCAQSASAQKAAPTLPGATLSSLSRTQLDGKVIRLAHKSENVIAPVISPDCPHIGKSLRELLNYARVNHPAIYRQALTLRRGGATKSAVRDFLELTICVQEGF